MIHFTRQVVKRWLDTLLHVKDTPERTARAFALGGFLGFSPFLGLHTLVGIAIAFMFNLNRVAVLLGVYSNLPWIIAPYYAFTTMAGAVIVRTRVPSGFRAQLVALFDVSVFHGEFWTQLITIVKPLLWPYTVGSMLGAMI